MVPVAARTCKRWFSCCAPAQRKRLHASTACSGGVALLVWSLDNGCALDEALCAHAAKQGNLELLQWLRAKDKKNNSQKKKEKRKKRKKKKTGQCPWDEETCKQAAQGGHWEVLQWARENGCPWNEKTIVAAAALQGHLHILQWATSQNLDILEGSALWPFTCATFGGHLHVLKWLQQALMQHQQQETMTDIRPWNEWACYFVAARQGHLYLLKWLREQEDPPPWIPAVCTVAASEGQLETLQWLRSQGCPWDEKTCSSAASGGHLEVLKWAIANGCPWHVQEANRAALLKGHHQVVQWLNEHASGR